MLYNSSEAEMNMNDRRRLLAHHNTAAAGHSAENDQHARERMTDNKLEDKS